MDFNYTFVSTSYVARKRANVFGGTSGFGQAIALGYAPDGADVIATSRREGKVEETAATVEECDAETDRLTCDVTDHQSLDRVREATVEDLGGIDVVIISRETVLGIIDES